MNPGAQAATDFTLDPVNWYTDPFKSPIYYGARVAQWFAGGKTGAGVDFISKTAPGRFATADAVADEAAALSLEGLTTQFTTENLEQASPDLRGAFHELNRFFNMAAYNPKGKEKLTGDRAADLARDEGLLFWVGWVSQNTVSIFSTADANGPFRRIVISFTCSALQAAVKQEAANELILAVSNVLNTPGLCPAE